MFRVVFFALLFLSFSARAAYFVNLPASPNITGSYTLSWNAEAGDSGFYLYETKSGTRTLVYSGSGSSKSFSAKANGTYNYELEGLTTVWIRGEPIIRRQLMDSYTLSVNKLSPPPKMSTPSADTDDNDYSIAISWSASTGTSISKYNLQVQKNSGSWSNAYVGTSRSFQYKPTSDGIYTFRVRAYNSAGWGVFSNTDSTNSAKKPSEPSSISGNPATTTSGSFTVSWGAASNADSYQLEQQTNSGSWAVKYSGTSRSKSFSLDDGVYRFRVRGKNTTGSYTSYGNFKYSSVSKVAKTPGTPGTISGVPTNSATGTFSLSWGAASGNVDYYNLLIEKDGVVNQTKIKVTSRSKVYQVTEDGTYRFKVEACNEVSGFVTCGGVRNSGVATVQIVPTPGAISTVDDQAVTSLNGSSLVSDLVAEIKGHSSVDGGAFNYSVPVTLPPGRRGMQPSISLNYSSQSGEGLAGYGWNLSAGGAVHRCTEIYDLDGSATSVLYDINDKLCINGKRLLKVNGTYGRAGATYQTERDPSFTVEQLGGHIGSNSAYFKVHYPNGNTEIYGNSSNSRKIRSGHSVAESWMLALIEDAFKNEVEYEYFGVTGNLYLKNIFYTGHSGTRGTRRANFVYSTIDGSEKFSFGGKSLSNRLLKRIDIYIDETLEANWRLEHASPANDGIYQIYLLNKLKYCDGSGNSDCIATDFDWYNSSFTYSEGANHPLESITDQFLVGQTIYREGDYDNDGVLDLSGADGIYLSGGGFMSWSSLPGYGSSGVGTSSGDSSLSNDIGEYRYTSVNGAMDFNGDGTTDIIYKDSNDRIKIASYDNGNISLLKDTGIDAGCYLSYSNLNTLAMCNNFVIDFDGDGRKDLLVATKAETSDPTEGIITYKAYMNSGNSFTFAGQIALNIRFSVNPIDVNGDGTIDLAGATFGKSPWWYETNYNKNTGQLTFTHRSHTLNVNFNEFLRTAPGKWIDFNGDGLPDILTLHLANSQDNTYTFSIAINKGNGSFASPVSTGKREFAYGSSLHGGVANENEAEGLVYNNFIKVFDFNGDGRQDLLVPTGTTSYRYQCWDHSTNQDCRAIDGAERPRFHIYDAFAWDVWITQEDGVSFQVHDLGSNVIGALATMSVVDLDGDGRDDFVSGLGFESSAVKRRWYYGSKSGGIGSNPRGYLTYLRDSTENYTIREVTTGMGVKAKVSYDQLANVSISNNSFSLFENYPYVRFTNTMRVVDTFEEDNGVGSLNTTQYQYGVPIFHLAGRGFQGFESIETVQSTPSMEVTGSNIDFKTTIEFEHIFPWSGMVKTTRKEDLTNNFLLSTATYSRAESVNPYITGEPYCFYSPSTVNTSYGASGEWLSTTTTDIEKNTLCQVTHKTVLKEDDYTSKTVINNTTYFSNGYISLPDSAEVESRTSYTLSGLPSGERAIRKVLRYTNYDPTTYVVTESGVKNGAGVIKRKKVFSDFDVYGQPKTITEGERWKKLVYSNDGYFVEIVRNRQWGTSFDASTSYFDKLTGAAESQINASGVSTDSTVNFLGQVLSTAVSKSGTLLSPIVYTQYLWGSGDYPVIVKTVQDGAPVVTEYLDSLGRSVKTETTGFDGSLIISETEFDERGNVLRSITPTASYSTRTSVEFGAYDALGRPEFKSVDDGLVNYVSNYFYTGLITTIDVAGTSLAEGESVSHIGSRSDSVGTMSRIYNSFGELLKTIDVKDGVTLFAYDSAGNPDFIKDAKGSVTTAVYDDLGQKISFSDPNMGSWSFTYNQFGELETQTDARGVIVQPEYDFLGRVRTVNGRTWSYDSAGKGLLDSTNSGSGEIKNFEYDSLLRVNKVTTTIDGINFIQEYAYHSTLGVLKAEKYPSNEVIGYEYNEYGYLEREFRHLLHADETLRKIDEIDAFGNVVKQVLSGNIYQNFYRHDNGSVNGICSGTSYSCATKYQSIDYGYDGMGNLTHQQNLITNLKEEYTYDNLMRVQAAQYSRNGTAEANIDYNYDAVGNLTQKSDYAGTYYYNSNRSQGGNAGPNAVRRVIKSSGSVNFSYDNNGNMLTGDGLSEAIYNVDNKPTRLIKNAVTTTFSYGADGMRFKQTKQSGSLTTTTYYIGKGFEREIQPGNKVLDKTYVGGHTTLYLAVSGNPSYPTSVLHSLEDRLGSPTVLLTGRDSTPNIIRYRAHGIFGRPIDAGTGNKLINLADWDDLARGYTGHEQLIEQQLIHMNGRVYDYNLGRFMSVDPFIQSPLNSQSLNPYTYIMNNPMAGVDPTGYVAQGTNASNWRTSGCDLDPMGCTSTPTEKAFSAYVGSGESNMHQSFSDNLEKFNKRMEQQLEDNWTDHAYAGLTSVTITDLPSSTNQGGDTERTWGSYLPFTQTGDESAQFWANRLVAAGGGFTDDPVASAGLFFSSLWTPNTAADTSFALFGGEFLALGGKALSYAGSKIIGNAQSTGTLGHETISKMYAYAYALNPNVTKVTMDLGYKRLMDGVKSMRLKYGPRPDVAAAFKDGSVRVKEIASKTDNPAQLIQRNANKMRNEGISGSVSVNNWAVQLQKWFGK
ncbi:FG-GAP-like repeat-containing protein [Pseudoalteromonas sp. P1-25]|uniref:FG-GAP-like repeat-containing protein n=1 Tax=Pseudoalteromonas sp. P1-25 TaxID=1723758 RepID=UPI0006D66600|nr:FG-GAP-like repeat-containing protein [Pseudoalteromonas sp. P1-25]KPZ54284.1 tRNA3(Ser)-specific nuclease WapA precursor [Pseudoalteromonas sp. P1-25]